MSAGVPILGTVTKMQSAEKSPLVFRITLVQGLNRQIRRMCKHFGYEVTKRTHAHHERQLERAATGRVARFDRR